MTLPLLHALKTSSKTEKSYLIELLKGEKDERKAKLEEARDIIAKSGGFEY